MTSYSALLTKWFLSACCEGVPDVVADAGVGGVVVAYLAHSIDATSARTGVDALVPLACFVGRTVGVHHTLRPACYVGVSEVLRNALT
jgi:fucose permease